MAVIIETSIGQLTVDLYTEERPRCSKNFLKLCKVKYYNFSLFHSVQQNLVAQTGDPTATGRGGMSVYGMVYGEQARYFDMEVTPRIKHKKRGLLSMVNNGNGRHGSQFFVTLGQDLDYLDGEHTVFGEVAEGFEVLDKLNEAYCDEKHRPYRDIRIFHTVILDDPFDDPEGLVIPDKSPGPTQEMLESDRIGVDEEVDDTKGMTQQEVEELHAEREAKANAQLLEMVGDIPDADVRPPDNVLFVCKLNPVTTDEDLEMIFSRFGPIVSCEVIKDHKTKESLQYAFVEFEKPEHCENAYFKMDNVLIDDRRIHVDFSQSVSKLRPMAAGKKVEEEKEDQPRYVLKDQQRRDNNYDLVFEHDLAAASTESKKSKKHKHHRHSDSDQDGDSKDQRKKKEKGLSEDRMGSRSRSPHRADTDRNRDRESSDSHHRQPQERKRQSSSSPEDRRKRERKTSSSEEYSKRDKRKGRSSSSEEDTRKEQRKKERKKKERSPSPEKERRKEKKRKDRSPSPEKDRRKEKKKKDRSPSPEKGRKKERRRKERSPSSEEDRRKERRRKERSPSSEEDRRKERRRKERSPSSEEDRRKERRRKERSPSSEEDRRKERRRKERSPSSEDDRRKERKKRERSPSSDEDRRKKRKDRSPSPEENRRKKKKERRSSSSEEDRRKKRKKEERRREDHSSSSHRDKYARDRR